MNRQSVDKDKKGYNLLKVKDKVQIHRFAKSQEATQPENIEN